MLFTKFGPISSQSGFMLDGWSYGSVLTIPSGTVSEDLYNFPATVYLNSSNFDFSKAKSDGSDIRFTDKDLNHLKFERVEHNIVNAISFDGIDDYVSVPSSSDLDIGVNNFTIDCHAYFTSLDSTHRILFGREHYYSAAYMHSGYRLEITATNVIQLEIYSNATTWNFITTTYTPPLNQFIHFAIVKNGTLVTLYANGISIGTVTISTFYDAPSAPLLIGTCTGSSVTMTPTNFFKGMIKNFRLSIGIARYTTNFTPPTQLYQLDEYTKVLMYFNSTLTHKEETGKITTIYSLPLYIPSIGKYTVQIPQVYSSQDTEIYMWYGNSNAYNNSIESWQDQTGKKWTYNGNVKIKPKINNENTNERSIYKEGVDTTILSGGYIFTWNYASAYAVTADPTKALGATSINLGTTQGSTSMGQYVKVSTINKISTKGYKNLKVRLTGSSGYKILIYLQTALGLTGQIIYPTVSNAVSAYTYDGGTTVYSNTIVNIDLTNYQNDYHISVELHSTGGTRTLAIHELTLSGLEEGLVLDGSGDWLTLTNNSEEFNFSNNDFTLEAIITKTTDNRRDPVFYQGDLAGNNSTISCMFGTYEDTTGKGITFSYGVGAGYTIVTAGVNLGTSRVHIMASRQGSNLYLFANGVLVKTHTIGSAMLNNSTYAPMLGGMYSSASFLGTIHGIRITKGRARYTANFTPTTSFEIDGSDVVLCTNFDTIYDSNYAMVQHMGDHLIDASGNGNNGTATGTSIVNTIYGKSRNFINTDKITIPDSASLDLTSAITLMAFVRYTQTTNSTFIEKSSDNTNYQFQIGSTVAGCMEFRSSSGTGAKSSVSYADGNYRVFHGIQNGTSSRLLTDGTQIAAVTLAAPTANTSPLIIGSRSGTIGIVGSLSEVRLSNIVRSDSWVKAESLALKAELFQPISNV